MTRPGTAIQRRGLPPCSDCGLDVCWCLHRTGPLGVYYCPEWHPAHPGPWANEPDRVDFRVYGYACVVARGGLNAWCGYVPVPPTHPAHGATDCSGFSVHGGVTHTGPMPLVVMRVQDAMLTVPSNWWWIGFDCGHGGLDFAPDMAEWPRWLWLQSRGTYRTLAYAMVETTLLAWQLAAVA